jgi:hypothetical protein
MAVDCNRIATEMPHTFGEQKFGDALRSFFLKRGNDVAIRVERH